MSEQDAALVLFKMHINEPGFRGQNPAQQNDELGDAVRDFIEDRQFAVASGIDAAAFDREVSRIAERFENVIQKSRAKIAGAKKEPAPSPYLFAKSVSGAPLAKGEVASRMFGLLEKLRDDCVGNEETLLEKAARALDVAAFSELAERIVGRLKARAA